ncbi:unnamed protein product [Ixodes hexagonus]
MTALPTFFPNCPSVPHVSHCTLPVASTPNSTHKEFQSVLQKFYDSTIEGVDFKQGAEEACLRVNAWVEEVTMSKIKDLLPPGAVSDRTALNLLNTVYFKGNWNVDFDPALTSRQKFYEAPGKSTMVDMICTGTHFTESQCVHGNTVTRRTGRTLDGL